MANNREIPRYEKSVAIQPVQQPDPAAAGNAMINAFRNFSEGVNSVTTSITKEQATQQKDILKNNISNTYKQFALDALRNPDQNAAIEEYNRNSKEYASQLTAQTNHFNRPYVGNLVDYYHNEHLYTIEKNAILQNQRQLSVAAYKRMNDATRDWQTAISNSVPMVDEKGEDHQFDSAHALFADQLRNMETDARMKALDPVVMGKARNELIKNYTTSIYLKKYEDHVAAGQGNEFIAKIREPQYHIPGVSEEDKYTIVGKMIKIRDQGKRGARLALGQLTDKMSDEVLNVSHGAIPNVDLQNAVDGLDPVKGESFKQKVDVAQAAYGATQATQYMSPQERADYQRDLLDIDFTKEGSAKKQRIADASIKAIKAQEVKMKADPMAYVMQNPHIQEAVNNYEQAFNADAVGQDHQSTPFNSTVPKPWNSIIREQLNLGFTLNGNNGRVRLIEAGKVKGIVNDLMTAEPADKLRYMDKLNEEYGGGVAFNLVMKQLQSAGLPASYALMAGIDPNSPDRELVAAAASVPPTQVEKELHASNPAAAKSIGTQSIGHTYGTLPGANKNYAAFLSTLPSYNGAADVEYRNNLAAQVKQIANYVGLTQGLSYQQAVARAENIIADRYAYTSVGNSSIRLPKNVPAETIKSYAAMKEKELASFPFNFDGVNKGDAEFVLRGGSWKNNDTDSGLVWVDHSGVMWTDHNGHPFGFSFHEAVSGEPDYLHPTAQSQEPVNEEQVDTGISPGQIPDISGTLDGQNLNRQSKSLLTQAREGKL